MMTNSFFGEINELASRAVWYSDEEDDDDDDALVEDIQTASKKARLPIDLASHESMRSATLTKLERLNNVSNIPRVVNCIVSLTSSVQYRNHKLTDTSSELELCGCFGDAGRVFLCPYGKGGEQSLYINFDVGHQHISGPGVAYFVETIRDQLYTELSVDSSTPVIILSQQFSRGDILEYLTCYSTDSAAIELPFGAGRPISPPYLFKNQFESALFEQLTLTLRPAFIVCLPDPRDFWFDKGSSWPGLADEIIEHRLGDSKLDKTLIFT